MEALTKPMKYLKTAAIPTVIRTEHISNPNLGCCRYTNMLSPEIILFQIFYQN
jgi:hypothetical protein